MRKVTYLRNPTDDIVRLMIYTTKEGVYVFGFDDLADASSKWDNLFEDLESALEFCRDTYYVQDDRWINVEDPYSSCQNDWIERVRIKGREKGNHQWQEFEKLRNGHWIEISNTVKMRSFAGMTGNERLFAAGLLSEFEKSLRGDKQNAEKILSALQLDELSIKNILQ